MGGFLPCLITLIWFILFLINCALSEPQVFDESEMCEHKYGHKIFSFKRRIWEISKKRFTIYFSLCNETVPKCGGDSACLIETNGQIVSLGKYMHFVKDKELILRSTGVGCSEDPEKNSTLSVILECTDSSQPDPTNKLSYDPDECKYEIRMLQPDCNPKCTANIDNQFFFDLRNFQKTININTVLNNTSLNFSLSLCSSNPDCGGSVSSCLKKDGENMALALENSQTIVYNVDKDQLIARGRTEGRRRNEIEVILKCNWDTKYANPVFKPQLTQGRKYHFEVESSFACIKLPQNCMKSDYRNFQYNLNPLNRPNGWQVSGRNISLNICGDLRQSNICSEQYSQVCEQTADGFLNKGSILLPLKFNGDSIVAIFKSGSLCKANTSFSYSTEIQFNCHDKEEGPVFHDEENCVTHLMWNTPSACPINYRKSDSNDCRISHPSNPGANIDLHYVYERQDKQYMLSPSGDVLEYNLCGPLNKSCGRYENASFCIRRKNDDFLIAWDERNLISDNDGLRLELRGNLCPNQRTSGGVIVNFICDYSIVQPTHQLVVLDDQCRFNVTVHTKHACLSITGSEDPFTKCTVKNGENFYNLTSLSSRQSNRVIKTDHFDFILNICGPILSGPEAQCIGNTMVCLKNNTSANIKDKYQSLGMVGGPKVVNNSLIIEATSGAFCPLTVSYHRSIINFRCAPEEEGPKFVSQTECETNFEWRTPEACPKNETCFVSNSNSQLILDFTELPQKQFQVNISNDLMYEFNLCNTSYKLETSQKRIINVAKQDLYETKNGTFLMYDLGGNCTGKTLNKIILKIVCGHENTWLSIAQEESTMCTANLILTTKLPCRRLIGRNSTKEVDTITRLPETTSKRIRTTAKQVEYKIEEICSTPVFTTSQHFNLTSLKSEEIIHGKNEYIINFDRTSEKCDSLLCKNKVPITSNSGNCPEISYSLQPSQLNITYSTTSICKEHAKIFLLEVLFKCNASQKSRFNIEEDENCKLRVNYYQPEACISTGETKLNEHSTSTAAIVGGCIGGLFVILCAIAFIVFVKKPSHCQRMRYNSIRSPKSQTMIYCKDMND